jgi:tetratricopeptide (TPR) repeat protein
MKILEMDPNFYPAHNQLTQIYANMGMYDEAFAEAEKAIALWRRDGETLPTLGILYWMSGNKDKAKEILDELHGIAKQRYVSPSNFAVYYWHLGDIDQGFEWLEKAYEVRDQQIAWAKVHPAFDPLRSDPRFKAMLKKMNLE